MCPQLSDLYARRGLKDEAWRHVRSHCTRGGWAVSHACGRVRQGVHMLPLTKALDVSGC